VLKFTKLAFAIELLDMAPVRTRRSLRWPLLLGTSAALLTLSCARGAAGGDSQGVAVASGAPLAETATDNLFAPDAYTIAAGESYTLTMINAGDAIHNWHIVDAKAGSGREIATPLTAAHKSSAVTFAIARSGVYHFQCDVHPDTMKGTLTVRGS